MGEVHEILRYKRPCDSWLCPECDTENSLSLGKCSVCGCIKTSSATIVNQWTEAEDRPITPPKKTSTYVPSGPIFKDRDRDDYIYREETDYTKKILLGIAIVIIIILILSGLSQNVTYAAYSASMNECKYQTEYSLFNSSNYNDSKDKIEEITANSDSSEMVNECDHIIVNDLTIYKRC